MVQCAKRGAGWLKLNITVIIPTYRRVNDLLNCLDGLDQQRLQPYELLVVVRSSDLETKAALDRRAGAPGG